MSRRVLFLLTILLTSCQRPDWLPDFKNLLQTTNAELEEISPTLAADSTPGAVLVGLRRLDRMMDRVLAQLRSLVGKYPHVLDQSLLVKTYLGTDLKRLAANMQNVYNSAAYWVKKTKPQKEFEEIAISIVKKIREADTILRKPS